MTSEIVLPKRVIRQELLEFFSLSSSIGSLPVFLIDGIFLRCLVPSSVEKGAKPWLTGLFSSTDEVHSELCSADRLGAISTAGFAAFRDSVSCFDEVCTHWLHM